MTDETKVSGSAAGDPPAGNGEAANSQQDTVAITDPADQLAAVVAERDQLASEKSALQDLMLRRQADFDNYRRRAERERFESRENGRMDALIEFLTIADDFERALKIESADKEYAKGFEMIYLRMQDILKGLGLEAIVTTGQKFDPNLHHAVDKAVRDDVDENTVLEEYQRGYNFKGRLLRPAMVKVAVRG